MELLVGEKKEKEKNNVTVVVNVTGPCGTRGFLLLPLQLYLITLANPRGRRTRRGNG